MPDPVDPRKRPKTRDAQAVRAEGWIKIGSAAAVVGLILSLTEYRELGGVITLSGLSACIVGLHRYGRSGPDQTSETPRNSVVASQDGDGDVIP